MGFFAIAIAYTMRVCLSVAITEMVVKPNRTEQHDGGHSVCPAEVSTTNVTESVRIFRFYFAIKKNSQSSVMIILKHLILASRWNI